MNLNEYQDLALNTKLELENAAYPYLKLSGEAGEVAEKFGKLLRDKGGIVDDAFREDIAKELGDVLWYIASIADDLGLSLDYIGTLNIEKLTDRANRNVIKGSGDNR